MRKLPSVMARIENFRGFLNVIRVKLGHGREFRKSIFNRLVHVITNTNIISSQKITLPDVRLLGKPFTDKNSVMNLTKSVLDNDMSVIIKTISNLPSNLPTAILHPVILNRADDILITHITTFCDQRFDPNAYEMFIVRLIRTPNSLLSSNPESIRRLFSRYIKQHLDNMTNANLVQTMLFALVAENTNLFQFCCDNFIEKCQRDSGTAKSEDALSIAAGLLLTTTLDIMQLPIIRRVVARRLDLGVDSFRYFHSDIRLLGMLADLYNTVNFKPYEGFIEMALDDAITYLNNTSVKYRMESEYLEPVAFMLSTSARPDSRTWRKRENILKALSMAQKLSTISTDARLPDVTLSFPKVCCRYGYELMNSLKILDKQTVGSLVDSLNDFGSNELKERVMVLTMACNAGFHSDARFLNLVRSVLKFAMNIPTKDYNLNQIKWLSHLLIYLSSLNVYPEILYNRLFKNTNEHAVINSDSQVILSGGSNTKINRCYYYNLVILDDLADLKLKDRQVKLNSNIKTTFSEWIERRESNYTHSSEYENLLSIVKAIPEVYSEYLVSTESLPKSHPTSNIVLKSAYTNRQTILYLAAEKRYVKLYDLKDPNKPPLLTLNFHTRSRAKHLELLGYRVCVIPYFLLTGSNSTENIRTHLRKQRVI